VLIKVKEKKEKLSRLITTSDGSHTIFVPELNEHYHSVHGAVQESSVVFIRNGYDYCKNDPLNIFEVGFGTGLNALLTIIRSEHDGRAVNYTSIEKYPLDDVTIRSLNHSSFAGGNGKEYYDSIHAAEWNTTAKIKGNFSLTKLSGDMTTDNISGSYDLIYFDAFGPDKQPEMWTENVFVKIAGITSLSGVLVTYSSKGAVKRILKSCGFDVSLLPGPPGKREMIRAVRH
jgi:tRNA U34 5-methylaminomethyl-2-thiouridine-forming methyltransferase MnmC